MNKSFILPKSSTTKSSFSLSISFLLPCRYGFFYCHEEIKRELKRIPIYECWCNERLKAKAEGSTRLAYTGLRGGLEHVKIETRLRDERFENMKGEYVI